MVSGDGEPSIAGIPYGQRRTARKMYFWHWGVKVVFVREKEMSAWVSLAILSITDSMSSLGSWGDMSEQ